MTSTTRPQVALVDDDPSVLRAVDRLLRSAGFSTVTFASGEAWLSTLERRLIDADRLVLVLDVRMTPLDGLGVQRRMADLDISVPIIFISAHEDRQVEAEALAAGARAFLQKPLNGEVLIEAVRQALAPA